MNARRLGSHRPDRDELRNRALRRGTMDRIGRFGRHPTVADVVGAWGAERRRKGIRDHANERARIEHHVVPVIGDIQLRRVEPHHLDEIVMRMKDAKLAPKTIRNVAAAYHSLAKYAERYGLVRYAMPRFTSEQIGPIVDKDPSMRLNAFFTAEEAGRLVYDPSILPDRRVAYALAFLTGMRLGEIAGLRWCNVDLDMQPLGAIDVVETYDGRPTKTRTARRVPIVPQLAEILDAWFEVGFEEVFGRPPTPDDFVVPRPPYGRGPAGSGHSKNSLGKAFAKDLARLGLRHRRFHDVRRTFISLALSNGALREVVEHVTHTSRPRPSAFDAYITFDWPVVCREISKLVLPNPFAATGAPTGAVHLQPSGHDRS